MRGLVIIQHEVNNVELAGYEDGLEDCIPQARGRIRPEEIEVSRDVYGEVEELGLE